MQEPSTPFLLKNIYNAEFLNKVVAEMALVHPIFPEKEFLNDVFDQNWTQLELKQRIRHISLCLRKHLPESYPIAVSILVKIAQNIIARNGQRMSFEWGILPDFVEAFGIDAPEVSIPALEIITQLASAEFAIRPFLLKYPDRMYAQMETWSMHDSAMVRRLSSEGFRPRLPWGMGIPVLKKSPKPMLPILNRLKNDPAETVRRSVANHLNDISKDHPDVALELAKTWKGTSPETDWVVRHACRGLLKKGHPEALRIFGFDAHQNAATINHLTCSPSVKIGDRLYFSFSLQNTTDTQEMVRLEYAIDYITSTGKKARKIFKISELELSRVQEIHFEKNQRFQDFTTRKHYEGAHRLEILVNGIVLAGTAFDVIT
jgi:3-methyladenine DNA glycosylase AlkC